MKTDAEFFGKIINYRLIYLSLNEYSDECLTVGLLLQEDQETMPYFVSAQYALDALRNLFGAEYLKTYEFGTQYFRDAIRTRRLPFDMDDEVFGMFRLGSTVTAECSDANRFARDVLEISSSLFRYEAFSKPTSRYISQKDVVANLYDALSKRSPLVATRLFSGRTVLIDEKQVHMPIFGEQIMGSPLSLITKMVEDAVIKGEALFARFNFLRVYYEQTPSVYALVPGKDADVNLKAVNRSIRELEAVAEANSVTMRKSDSVEELAEILERDELAA